MQFDKSYRLLRFMNCEHNVLIRGLMAGLGWCGAMVATRSLTLAQALAAEFWTNRFDVAFRKAARFARYLSPRFDIFNDPFFNFTTHTTAKERQALHAHLDRIKPRMAANTYQTDKLYILAADIHHQLANGKTAQSDIDLFYQTANTVLASLNTTRAEHTTTNKPDKPPRTPDFDKAQAVRALHDLSHELPLEQWPWFVVSGTFLGLHREGAFLAHDYDIDIGINAEDVDCKLLLKTLRQSRLFVVKKIDNHIEVLRDETHKRYIRKRPSIYKIVHKNGLQVDVFIHYTENGVTWHGSSIHRWENTPFGLEKRKLEGVTVYAPANPDTYLTENYGDWRTPVTSFDCTTGTPNLVVAKNFISLALFIKRYTYFLKFDEKQASKLQRTLEHGQILEKTGTNYQLRTTV